MTPERKVKLLTFAWLAQVGLIGVWFYDAFVPPVMDSAAESFFGWPLNCLLISICVCMVAASKIAKKYEL